MRKPHPSQPTPAHSRPQPSQADPPKPAPQFAEGYQVNDPVDLSGGLGKAMLNRLRINDAPPIYLGERAFLVLLILACHQLTLQGQPAPVPIYGPAFLSASDILLAIDAIQAATGIPPRVLEDGTAADVPRIVYEIRKKLRKLGLSPALIETGPRGTGYRLSTPPGNVTVTLIRPTPPRPLTGAPSASLLHQPEI